MKRKWKPYYEKIIDMYKNGLSPADIGRIYNVRRETIKNIIARKYKLRTQSEASMLAVKQGKKDKAIKQLIVASKTFNRFNLAKTHCGEEHPLWINDRSKVKENRSRFEEREFVKEVLKDRNYKCELTGEKVREISYHHIKPVWKYPELRYVKENCIVTLRKIHKFFHKKYGCKSDEYDWNNFINNKEYLEAI